MHLRIRNSFFLLVLFSFGFATSAYPGTDPKGTKASCIEGQIDAVLITPDWLSKMRKEHLSADPQTQALRKTLQKEGFVDAALNEEIVKHHNTNYTTDLREACHTDQMQVGDCWVVSWLNAIRNRAYADGKVDKDFLLSRNQPYFFSMLGKADKFLDDRIFFLQKAGLKEGQLDDVFNLANVVNDGGYSSYFLHIVAKHGLVPESAMPVTTSTKSSTVLNQELTFRLDAIAKAMKDKYKSFKFASDQTELTQEQTAELLKIRALGMEDIYHVLASHLGVPPSQFTVTLKDGSKKVYTPQSFAKELGVSPEDFVVIASDPTLKYGRTYITPGSRMEVQGPKDPESANAFLNVPNRKLLEIVANVIEKHHFPVPFSSDVTQAWVQANKNNPKSAGIMHPDIFKSDPIYFGPAGPNFNKVRDQKTLRNFGVTEPDHEMVLTAVDRPVRGKPPLKLRVENQWGDTIGTNGDMHMYRQWFPYVTDATVPREALPKEILKLFEQPPHPLPGD